MECSLIHMLRQFYRAESRSFEAIRLGQLASIDIRLTRVAGTIDQNEAERSFNKFERAMGS